MGVSKTEREKKRKYKTNEGNFIKCDLGRKNTVKGYGYYKYYNPLFVSAVTNVDNNKTFEQGRNSDNPKVKN